jgi:hypothetical protein
VSTIQKDIARQAEFSRTIEEPQDGLLSSRQSYFSNLGMDSLPLSPRQGGYDDRRPSLLGASPRPPPYFRPPAASHLNSPNRRYGSIGAVNAAPAATFSRLGGAQGQQLPQPPAQHPLASVQSHGSGSSSSTGPGLARRHTSADIRATEGWPPQPPQPGGLPGGPTSPFDANSPANWPPSPSRPANQADQQVRDTLASYEFGAPRRQRASPNMQDGIAPSTATPENGNGWGFAAGATLFKPRLPESAPATRRSSMASNVHNLLNPAETVERDDEDSLGPEEKKRKRAG